MVTEGDPWSGVSQLPSLFSHHEVLSHVHGWLLAGLAFAALIFNFEAKVFSNLADLIFFLSFFFSTGD